MLMEDWTTRARGRQRELGLSDADIERLCGFKPGTYREWLKRGRTPSVDKASSLAKGLGYTLNELFEGEEIRLNLIVLGLTKGNAMWAEVASKHAKVVPLTLASENLISIEISKQDAAPQLGYREGDIISGEKIPFTRAGNLIGREVIAQAKDGRKLVGVLMAGGKRDTANIRPFDMRAEELKDVALEWVAPIQFVIKAQT